MQGNSGKETWDAGNPNQSTSRLATHTPASSNMDFRMPMVIVHGIVKKLPT